MPAIFPGMDPFLEGYLWPDDDVLLDLGMALHTLYERSCYDLAIDYNEKSPPPAFSEKDQQWMKTYF